MSERPLVGPAALRAVVAAYPALGRFARIAADGLSVNSATCLFETDTGVYFAKRAAGGAGLTGAHVISRRLEAAGYPTPRLHADARGETLHPGADGVYAIYDRARGEDRYGAAPVFAPYASRAEAREAGFMLARFHLVTSGLALSPRAFSGFTARWGLTGASPLAAFVAEAPRLGPFLAGRPELPGLLARIDARRPVVAAALAEAPAGVIHGDFIKRNLFWTGETVADVVDFDLWNVESWVYDLALALIPAGFDWPRLLAGAPGPDVAALDAFLAGYESARPLTGAEREVLVPLLETARVGFYLSVVADALAREDAEGACRFWELLCRTTAWFDRHPGWWPGRG